MLKEITKKLLGGSTKYLGPPGSSAIGEKLGRSEPPSEEETKVHTKYLINLLLVAVVVGYYL